MHMVRERSHLGDTAAKRPMQSAKAFIMVVRPTWKTRRSLRSAYRSACGSNAIGLVEMLVAIDGSSQGAPESLPAVC